MLTRQGLIKCKVKVDALCIADLFCFQIPIGQIAIVEVVSIEDAVSLSNPSWDLLFGLGEVGERRDSGFARLEPGSQRVKDGAARCE